MTKRREKKSESLEIRLPYSQKQAFMEACRERGVTASDTLRQFIADDLDGLTQDTAEPVWSMTLKNNPFKTAAGVAATALAAAALGTSASVAEDDVFGRFDANSDNKVSYAEFMAQLTPGGDLPAPPTPPAPPGTRIESASETRVTHRGMDLPPALPAMPRQTDRAGDLFTALDADGSGDISVREFESDGTIVRRTDETIEINGKQNRLVGLEVTTYDVTEAGSISVGKNMLSKVVAADASEAAVEQAFRELQQELSEMSAEPPAPPKPPAN
ncbi:MAG: hypothetical protein HRU11_05290 [Parvularculaceae bacterium]|nr:hypothetical protein [Parvularculaceae bacterium]